LTRWAGPDDATLELVADNVLSGRERTLRRWIIALAALAGVLVILVLAVVLYWLRFVLPTEPDPFTRGPWVAEVSGTTARIAWRIEPEQPVDVSVTTPGGRTVTADEQGVLRGLAPGTRYGWTASAGGGTRAFGSVTTPPRTAGAPVRFIITGDYGVGGEDQYAVARVGAAQGPAFTVSTGDNVYLAAAPVLFDQTIFRPMRPLMSQGPFLGVMGDHDTLWQGGRPLAEALGWPGNGDRSVQRYGRLAFITLGVEGDAADLPFLRRALADTRDADARWVLIHRPPEAGNPVLPVIRQAGAAAVLSGHLHRYERRTVDGVLCLTVGTGGAPRSDGDEFTPESADAVVSIAEFGSLRADYGAGAIRYAFIDAAGAVLDRFTTPASG
jgi:predicted phosphodiesterase